MSGLGTYETADGYDVRRGSGSIVTPEAVVLDFELAGVASRSIAIVVDVIVQLLALLALVFIVGLATVGSDVIGIVVLLVGLILIVIGYPVAMETLNNGRSFGRMIVGTRVVTVEGAPVRFRHAFIRALLAIVDLFASSGAVAVVAALVTRRGQRLGDLVAGTMVIRERKEVGSGWIQPIFAAPYLVVWAKDMDTSPLGDDGYQLIRDYLRRVPELGQAQAAELGEELEAFVTARMPLWPRPQRAPVVDWLRTIAAKAQGSGLAPPPPPTAMAASAPGGAFLPGGPAAPTGTARGVPLPPPPGYGASRATPPPPPAGSQSPPPPAGSPPPPPGTQPPPPGSQPRPLRGIQPPPTPGQGATVPPPAPPREPGFPGEPAPPAPNDGGFATPG